MVVLEILLIHLKPEITSKSTRTGFEGFDFVVYVDTVIYNRGGSGKVTVWAQVIQGSNEWSKKQDIYMDEEEMRSLTFTFREFSFWDLSTGSYNVWTET